MRIPSDIFRIVVNAGVENFPPFFSVDSSAFIAAGLFLGFEFNLTALAGYFFDLGFGWSGFGFCFWHNFWPNLEGFYFDPLLCLSIYFF